MKLRRAHEEVQPIAEPEPDAPTTNTPEHECDHQAHLRIEEKLDRILAALEADE